MRARRIHLDTHDQSVILTRRDCPVCRSEGFSAQARVRAQTADHHIVATLYQVDSDWLDRGEIGLSETAWKTLSPAPGDEVFLSHPQPLDSLSFVRGRIFGQPFGAEDLPSIISDIAESRYADIHIAMFLTAIAARGLHNRELIAFTRAMIDAGDRLSWPNAPIADKHCVGGLPGNRTTPLVVAIVAACGVWMPKTSSRAITSPAGTADTMETLCPVDLDPASMRRVVEKEGACVVWGGSVRLSPVDDMLIRVARVMDLDAEDQMIASVMSKKIAAGATHLVLDLPVGDTAKIRSNEDAEHLGQRLRLVAEAFGLTSRIVISDGRQPVGRGIGPVLEARDVLAVLDNAPDAPQDLRARALHLAAELLELAGAAEAGQGRELAEEVLRSGRAARKFEAICKAQGGLRDLASARHRFSVMARRDGVITRFDNRRLGRVAKLAGAPGAAAAGVELHVKLDESVVAEQPLYTIHAETHGELDYAREFAFSNGDIIQVG